LKGYIPIEIPTKRYIKAYIISRMGSRPLMDKNSNFGNKLHDLLQHQTGPVQTQLSKIRYNARLKMYINYHTFYHRGAFLNERNIKHFNLYVERQIKSDFRMYMDFYISMVPSFEDNLERVRTRIGIDIEEWSDDSMKKDYYRYRKSVGLPLLYKFICSATFRQ
jgi:hypothetical protein